ncbi:hypothetical protein P171DRAFT_434607 [Karstenula rhodostoma CBS 690.94]|uniref:Rhodopsin domain-containing protein n=1 Tax=Karstenula rhodostoma CBS 690.94 TaxID=1392251 RepID=A0A9P4U961_9PLEO|nr:hypothetical protein P171DRAFT_434607 [Karstenula rhodostoma CBS 690.94]
MDATSVKLTTSVLSVVATLAVGGRFWARKLKKQHYDLDDWTVLASLVVMWALAAVILAGAVIGLYDSHELNSTTDHQRETSGREQLISKYNFIKCVLLIAGLGLVKLSVVFLYRRIFNVVRTFDLYSLSFVVLLAAWTIAFLFANVFQCGTHLSALWGDADSILRYCKVSGPASYGFVVSDIITDILVLVSPVPIVWHMKVSTARKLGITGVFGLGLLSTAAACGRLYTFLEAIHNDKTPWQMESELAIWAVIELSVAVVAACLPVMRPLLQSHGLGGIVTSVLSVSTHRSRQKEDPSWVKINNV